MQLLFKIQNSPLTDAQLCEAYCQGRESQQLYWQGSFNRAWNLTRYFAKELLDYQEEVDLADPTQLACATPT